MAKNTLIKLLRLLAQAILRKYTPDVIGVSGSAGKTSAKEAIYTVIKDQVSVRRNIKNYNNEIGLPLTVIGVASGGRSIWQWIKIFAAAVWLIVWRDQNYPKVLILEMGIDRPGDMRQLVTMAPCKVGVMTNIGTAHIEFFKTKERIAKEKAPLISHLTKSGWAVLNADDDLALAMADHAKARVVTYGINNPDADIIAREIKVSQTTDSINGLSFKLSYQGSTVPVLLPNVLGEHLVYAVLSGVALGLIYGMNLVEIAQALKEFVPWPGRMRVIAGIKETTIIDDTYNASPDATVAAVNTLGALTQAGTRYAILGDMLELGDYTEEGHVRVGQAIVNNKIDVLVTVGERAKIIAREAERLGMSVDNTFVFADTARAGRFVQDRLVKGDIILVKGSQGMRMEKIVKELMAEPLRASELLARQDWK